MIEPLEGKSDWRVALSDRERKEVEYCRVYVSDFGHGTDGHLVKGLVAKLAELLDAAYERVP